MNQQKVHPNLLTFNSVLKALRQCGALAKTQAPRVLNEMKALGIGKTHTAIHMFYYQVFCSLTLTVSGVFVCSFSSQPGFLRPHPVRLLQIR